MPTCSTIPMLAIFPLLGPEATGPMDSSGMVAGIQTVAIVLADDDGTGATLVANELQPHRSGLVARALRGADGVAGIVTGDGTRPPYRAGSFDRVLVDAPCTGLGALRRRPEARWARKQDDLVTLVMLQRSLVSSALLNVAP